MRHHSIMRLPFRVTPGGSQRGERPMDPANINIKPPPDA